MIDLRILCDEYDFSSLGGAFKEEFDCDVPANAEVVIVGEDEIKRLNEEFRNVDRVTDVLSFPALEGIYKKPVKGADFPYETEDGVLCLGSIAVCAQVARRQAEEYGHSIEREMFYLVTHGVCHLFGYDHEKEEDKAEMRKVEERVLSRLGITRG